MPKKLSRTDLTFPHKFDSVLFKLFEQQPQTFFKIPQIRNAITLHRLKSFPVEEMEVAENIDPSVKDVHDGRTVLEYSLDMIRDIDNYTHTLQRPQRLIDVLKSIYYIYQNRAEMKILCVGPRTEAEFFMLLAEDFRPENITGLDLISYSDYVDVGDMHHMPYDDNSFDIVFLGWVLTYSNNLQRVANECVRVAKSGGYIAIGVESPYTRDDLEASEVLGQIIIKSTDELLDLFDGHIYAVPFRHDVHRLMKDRTDMVMVVIELK